jgi:hypothetical protein
MLNLNESKKTKTTEIVLEEIKLDEINILEETNTPALGVICGYTCYGAVCGAMC